MQQNAGKGFFVQNEKKECEAFMISEQIAEMKREN